MTDPELRPQVDPESDEAKRTALAEASADAKLGPMLRYWSAKCRECGGLPRPSDVDAAELPAGVLPYLTLLDVIDGGRTFRVRLVGTASAAAVGADHTGKYLDETMPSDVLDAALGRYRAAIAHRRPVLTLSDYDMLGGERVRNRMMVLPLSSDGITVDRLLGVYGPSSNWLAQRALRDLDTAPYLPPKRSQIVL